MQSVPVSLSPLSLPNGVHASTIPMIMLCRCPRKQLATLMTSCEGVDLLEVLLDRFCVSVVVSVAVSVAVSVCMHVNVKA